MAAAQELVSDLEDGKTPHQGIKEREEWRVRYQEAMETLSACGLGALVTAEDGKILSVN